MACNGFQDIKTYSIGFKGDDERNFNEMPIARDTAKRFKTHHHEFFLDPDIVLGDLKKMVWHLDEPYGGGLPSWYIYKMMAQHVKVCLTGTGGDELFGNYGKARWYENRRKTIWKSFIKKLIKNFGWREAIEIVRYRHAHGSWMYFRDAIKKSTLFFGSRFPLDVRPTEILFEDIWNTSPVLDPFDVIPIIDFRYQLPEEFLHVTDRFSMAHSIEARVPYLDHSLVELVYKIPARIRVGQFTPKQFLKKALSGVVPDRVLNSPKRGFILPLRLWTRKQLKILIQDLLSPQYLRRQGIFSDRVFFRIVQPHLNGENDYTQFVWTLLMFQLWHEAYIHS